MKEGTGTSGNRETLLKQRLEIKITGIVQGVGFRPFVYNLARQNRLSGYVLNNTSGVSIDVEGERSDVDGFLESLRRQPPPRAVIFDVKSTLREPLGYQEFSIRESDGREEKFVPISPEIATCPDCLRELFDTSDRRYRHPFINCTNCGPRFTIVKDVPYDRKFTTMAPFPMCAACRGEYEDPTDRRFHAQPNACPECGPKLTLLDADGRPLEIPDIVNEACRLLKEGKILAIKGIGGYHLACDAQNAEAVSALRARKFREFKPFAVMVRDAETARRLCFVDEEEELLLSGTVRPIVLLNKRPDCPVAEDVAPCQGYHGVMLPYTPLHHLLLAESGMILVMTSGNISSEPIVYRDEEAGRRLKGIADYYIVHNREIHIRTDDSVSRVQRGREVVLRRSRGYVPFPILLSSPFAAQILGCGAELKNSFCLTRGSYAFMSHHIGDLENLETLTSFEKGIEHFKRIFNIEPTCVAYDLHPDYLSTKYALSLNGPPRIGVQHHHAHIVGCMSENGIDGQVLGVAFDGTGYGTDGKIWGGEFLVADAGGFQRVAHLEYLPLPGGDKAVKEPWRMAASLLYRVYGEAMLDLDIGFIGSLDRGRWENVRKMIDRSVNAPLTSSSGRLFDAVSALIGIRNEVYYEGQAAIEMEMAAERAEEGVYPFERERSNETLVILLEPLIRAIVSDIAAGVGQGTIASRFHNTMAALILDICLGVKNSGGPGRVALSGGVFQNSLLLEKTIDALESHGFTVYTHRLVPTNDGGIALGQVVVANEQIRRGIVQRFG